MPGRRSPLPAAASALRHLARGSRRAWGALTPAGRAVLPLGLGCALAGTRLHWEEVTALGLVLLAAWLLAWPASVRPRPRRVDLEVRPAHTTAGHDVAVVVTVQAGRLPLLSPVVDVPLPRTTPTVRLATVAPGHETAERLEVPAEQRGVYEVGPVHRHAVDPLGLVHRRRRWSGTAELFVRPATIELPSLARGIVADLEGTPSDRLSTSDLAFHALREYAPGDDLRHVHWRSSAKADTLLVRQYLETSRSHATVVLDPDRYAYAYDSDFELAVSIAASVVRRAVMDDFEVTLLCGERAATSRRGEVLLDETCRFELLEQAPPVPSPPTTTSLAVLVSGGRRSREDMRAAAATFPRSAHRLLVRADPDQRSGVSGLGDGERLLGVHALRDLPAILSSVPA